jgi:hypothetical protein
MLVLGVQHLPSLLFTTTANVMSTHADRLHNGCSWQHAPHALPLSHPNLTLPRTYAPSSA